MIDEIIKDGFDGIYLDWVEGFENDVVMQEAQKLGKDPAEEMILFIKEMKNYAAKRVSNFFIIQQNAASLLEGHSELLSTIDAIAQEAVWYDGDATDNWNDPLGYDVLNGSTLSNEYLQYLDMYRAQGNPVFTCEYALNDSDDAYARSYERGFVPYCTRRSLARLTTTPPAGY